VDYAILNGIRVKYCNMAEEAVNNHVPRRSNNIDNGGLDVGSSLQSRRKEKVNVERIGITDDTLTGRGGMNLFSRYLLNVGIIAILASEFASLRKSKKGTAIESIFVQIICFLADGTSRHITRFDELKNDAGYAAAIEVRQEDMLSSHSVKRFFKSFQFFRAWAFRPILQRLFVWRLKLESPKFIRIYIDAMVMDNDDAKKRHGSQPTYKKVNGFAPLHAIWNGVIIDAVFRGGKKHSNNGNTVDAMVRKLVKVIRKNIKTEIPIVFHIDSGFFDQKLFSMFDELGVGFVCSGKAYKDIRDKYNELGRDSFTCFDKSNDEVWEYSEFLDRRGTWETSYRAFFTRLRSVRGQLIIPGQQKIRVIYTNLGMDKEIDDKLKASGCGSWLDTSEIIKYHHATGRDELVHRAFKDFVSQKLPFKKFAPNTAFYYTSLLAFFLFVCFEADVCQPVVECRAYPSTVRRRIFDIAAKIVRSGGQITLKVTAAVWKELHFEELWNRSVAGSRMSGA